MTDQGTERRQRWRGPLSLLLAGAAFAYLALILSREADAAVEGLRSFTAPGLALGLGMALLMHLLKTSYYLEVCRRLGAPGTTASALAKAYAVSQVARYLPGKIWGVAYQIGAVGGLFPARKIILAHAVQMLQTNLLAVGVLAGMLGSLVLGASWPWAIGALVLLAVEFLHRWPALERMFLAVWARVRARPELAESDIAASPWLSTSILLAEWLAYYAMWWFLLGASLGWQDTLELATWYAAASLLAILAFVVPGGLAVREALFVVLAGTLAGSGELVVKAAVLRALLIVSEAITVGVVRLIGGRLMIRSSG